MSPRRSLQELSLLLSLLPFVLGVSCQCCSRSAPRLVESLLEIADLISVLIGHTQKMQDESSSPRQQSIDILHHFRLCLGQKHAVAQ